ncbi:MAG: alanine racemase [Eubacteriales bacterium]
MNPRNRRVVDPGKIEQNMREICSALPEHVRALAVVKADGYGHGALQTARAAIHGGASMLAVASVDEGSALRDGGIRIPILVLGAVTGYDVKQGVEADLIQTVCSPDMVRMCESAATETGKQTEVHLKIDTGMGRIGIRTEKEKEQVMKTLRECPHVKLGGAFTHFADADGGEDGERYTEQQFRRFLELTDGLPEDVIRHCCNSAAIHRHPEMHLDMVRAGISLYGYPPVKTDMSLEPCMTWTATVSYVKELAPGSYVSYGRTWQANRTIRAATVTCGYGDGYHRSASGKACVLIHGRRAAVIGRICMDQMVADVTDIPDVKPGDEVILIGREGHEQITAEDLAKWSGTISYEILLSVGSRVKKEIIHSAYRKGDEG